MNIFIYNSIKRLVTSGIIDKWIQHFYAPLLETNNTLVKICNNDKVFYQNNSSLDLRKLKILIILIISSVIVSNVLLICEIVYHKIR
jgi:hypothetical protein